MYDFPDDPVVRDLNVLLVGGAVRDLLLGRPIKERDWVVLGATPQSLLALGFQSVGRDFPVFLHPHTQEEFALARTERKVAAGHQGFEFSAHPDVTLEQDLSRRDFTINAMAIDRNGTLHDPFDGHSALQSRTLIPVGKAFREDPLRVFRGARFLAQLDGFSASAQLTNQVPAMASEFATLSVERLWAETVKAFDGHPEKFFQALNQWRIPEHLGLDEFFWETSNPDDSMSHRLADWNANAPDALDWPTRWRAPKELQTLLNDARQWRRQPETRQHLMLTAGVIKDTPRWQRLLAWIERHEDRQRLENAANRARQIQAKQLSDQYTGPALGQALKQAWLSALSDDG